MVFEHKIYKLSELNQFTVIKIEDGLVCYDDKINFAVMRFAFSNDKDEYYGCFWYGIGTGEPLREMRHSYFGDPPSVQDYLEGNNIGDLGYVFYFNKELMRIAFNILDRLFD